MSADVARLDLALLRAARTTGHTPARERAVARFSRFGEHGAGWLALGLAGAAADRGGRREWLRADRAIALAYALNQLVKLAVRRPRPELPGLPPLTSTGSRLSFPSAHATTSFAAVTRFGALGVPSVPLAVLAGALAASRVWLGVHWPSDVAAGALLGTVLGRVAP